MLYSVVEMYPKAAIFWRIVAPKRGGMRATNTPLGYESPPGFGLRQSSAALGTRVRLVLGTSIESAVARLVGKRQRTAAVQNAIARLRPPNRIGPFVGRRSRNPTFRSAVVPGRTPETLATGE